MTFNGTSLVQRWGLLLAAPFAPGLLPLGLAKLILDVGDLVRETIEATARPPHTGDIDEIRRVARAFVAADEFVAGVGARVAAIDRTAIPPDVWHGPAGNDARAAATAVAHRIGEAPSSLLAIGSSLITLADGLTHATDLWQQGRHELRQAGEDFAAATHSWSPLDLPDPGAMYRAVDLGSQGVRRCCEAYAIAHDVETRAAGRFSDHAGKARVGAMDLSPAFGALDAAVLADIGTTTTGADRDEFEPGVLAPYQAERAARAYAGLDPDARAAFQRLIDGASNDSARAYLDKALAAGHTVAEIEAFAAHIHGRDAAWLKKHLELAPDIESFRSGQPQDDSTGLVFDDVSDGTFPLIRQDDGTTCGSMVLLAARAQADPIYALTFTAPDGRPPTRAQFEQRLRDEQQRIKSETNDLAMDTGWWPKELGTPPWGLTAAMNHSAGSTGVTYGFTVIDNAEQAGLRSTLNRIDTAVDQGHPVPLLVGGSFPNHWVMVTGHKDGEYQLYNPWGRVITVSRDDLIAGRFDVGDGGEWFVNGAVIPDDHG